MIFLKLFSGWIIQAGPFALLCLQPFAKQLRFSLRKTVVITCAVLAGLAAAFALAVCALYEAWPASRHLPAAAGAASAAALIFCFLWYWCAVDASWPKKLFVFSYVLTGAFAVTSIRGMITAGLHPGRTGGLLDQGCALLVQLLLTAVFLPVLLLGLRRHCQAAKDSFTGRENLYRSALPGVLCAALSSGLLCLSRVGLYDPGALPLYMAVLASVSAAGTASLKILDAAHEKMEAQRNCGGLQRQLSIQAEQYRRTSGSMEAARRMRHDIKHHMVTIRGFLQSGEVKQAEQYLDRYLLVMKEYEIPKLCSHVVVNAVVGHYRTLAAERDVRFSVRITVPAELGIQDIDLSVLIGNLLENALDAAHRADGAARFVRFNMVCLGKMLVVTVDNGFNGTVNMEAGRYLSTKEQHSGFGLASIESIAEKYSGGAEFTHEADVFHSSVMLGMQLP